MFNLNSGYIGSKMSKRAAEAYNEGQKPWSKWRKTDILEYFDEAEKSQLKKYSLQTLKQYFLVRVAWHHTGSWFNATDFYEFNDRCYVPNYAVLDNYEKDNKVKPEILLKKAKVSWTEFEGTRRHHKKIEREAYAILKGDWAYTLDGKKKISGNYFQIIEEYSRAPKGTASEFQKITEKYKL